jgi:hypothetical protein
MTNNTSEDKLLFDLIRKIRQQRGIHDIFLDSSRLWMKAIKIFNIVSSSIVTLIVFADFGIINKIFPSLDNFWVMLTVGIISFMIFLCNALVNTFNIDNKEVEHKRAIELYSDLLRDIRKTHLDKLKDKVKEITLNQFNDRYMQITFSVIGIGGKSFIKSQSKYLRRQARRMAIKENPFLRPWQIKKQALKFVKEYQKQEHKL